MTPKELRQALKMWSLGLDTFEIADVLEVAESAVYAALDAWCRPVGGEHA